MDFQQCPQVVRLLPDRVPRLRPAGQSSSQCRQLGQIRRVYLLPGVGLPGSFPERRPDEEIRPDESVAESGGED